MCANTHQIGLYGRKADRDEILQRARQACNVPSRAPAARPGCLYLDNCGLAVQKLGIKF